MKTSKAQNHDRLWLQELLDEIPPLEMEKTKIKMQLAAAIEDRMLRNGWSKSQWAKKVNKNPSEITKWFSGTHNFTTDTLVEIASAFRIEISALFNEIKK